MGRESSGEENGKEDGKKCNSQQITYLLQALRDLFIYVICMSSLKKRKDAMSLQRKAFTWWKDLPLSSLVLNKLDTAVALFSLSHLQSSWQILANQFFKHLGKFSKYVLLFISPCQEWRPATYIICQGSRGCHWQKQDTVS